MFLAAVSGGLVALGLVATASSLGDAFYQNSAWERAATEPLTSP